MFQTIIYRNDHVMFQLRDTVSDLGDDWHRFLPCLNHLLSLALRNGLAHHFLQQLPWEGPKRRVWWKFHEWLPSKPRFTKVELQASFFSSFLAWTTIYAHHPVEGKPQCSASVKWETVLPQIVLVCPTHLASAAPSDSELDSHPKKRKQ